MWRVCGFRVVVLGAKIFIAPSLSPPRAPGDEPAVVWVRALCVRGASQPGPLRSPKAPHTRIFNRRLFPPVLGGGVSQLIFFHPAAFFIARG